MPVRKRRGRPRKTTGIAPLTPEPKSIGETIQRALDDNPTTSTPIRTKYGRVSRPPDKYGET